MSGVLSACVFNQDSALSSSSNREVPPLITEMPDNESKSGSPKPVPEDMIPRISVEELKKKIDSGENILIVDTRHTEEYDVDHIEGSVSVPLQDILDGKWSPPADKEIVLYCS